MMRFTEGDLVLTISEREGVAGFKFDEQKEVAGLSYCMKAVDFLVVEPGRFVFIEIKDLDHPLPADERVREQTREKRAEFLSKLKKGLQDEALVKKYRDSFLHLWAQGKADELKEIKKLYCVLIASDSLDKSLRPAVADSLKRKLPQGKPLNADWKYPIVDECVVVFSVEEWNMFFPDFKLERIGRP